MATASIIKNTIFSKWGIIAIIFALIYFTGGFSIITNNPAIIIFLILGIIIMNAFKGKK